MSKPLILLIFTIAAVFIILSPYGCKHTIGKCDGESDKSSAGDDDSHNSGKNCISCHFSGGSGESCFTLGGTVYDSLQTTIKSGGTMKLHTGPNGTGDMVLSLPIDKLGNFYTGQNINFIGGLYPAVTGKTGKTKYMGSAISLGSCASCHGNSTNKIWVQ